ncbi:LysR family transcriptional regulator [Sharpea azabuensis]
MSQSAVSQQLARLEEELGISLFNRESSHPQLTKEG